MIRQRNISLLANRLATEGGPAFRRACGLLSRLVSNRTGGVGPQADLGFQGRNRPEAMLFRRLSFFVTEHSGRSPDRRCGPKPIRFFDRKNADCRSGTLTILAAVHNEKERICSHVSHVRHFARFCQSGTKAEATNSHPQTDTSARRARLFGRDLGDMIATGALTIMVPAKWVQHAPGRDRQR
jgi:hypothetical protein